MLKLDVEGAEPSVLDGAREMLASSSIDVIVSEVRLVPGYEGGALLHDLIDHLAEPDYRPFGVYRFAKSSIGQSLWGDAVFLGPALRAGLVATAGAEACGSLDRWHRRSPHLAVPKISATSVSAGAVTGW